MMDERARRIALECKGFMHEEEGLRLHELAREHARLGPIIEIGSYCGKSAVYLGTGVREVGGVLVCVDHHRGSEENQAGWEYHDPEVVDPQCGKMDTLPWIRRTLERADLEQSVVLVVTDSATAATLIAGPIGMLFIDGGHSFELAFADYEAWSGKIARGGILAIHDLFPDPSEGGQAPIEVYRRAVASGQYDELPTVKTLGILRRR
jgi:predicted O-methyltransferase YrrM